MYLAQRRLLSHPPPLHSLRAGLVSLREPNEVSCSPFLSVLWVFPSPIIPGFHFYLLFKTSFWDKEDAYVKAASWGA